MNKVPTKEHVKKKDTYKRKRINNEAQTQTKEKTFLLCSTYSAQEHMEPI